MSVTSTAFSIIFVCIRYGTRESVAYVASRLNATYASTYRVLHEVLSVCGLLWLYTCISLCTSVIDVTM